MWRVLLSDACLCGRVWRRLCDWFALLVIAIAVMMMMFALHLRAVAAANVIDRALCGSRLLQHVRQFVRQQMLSGNGSGFKFALAEVDVIILRKGLRLYVAVELIGAGIRMDAHIVEANAKARLHVPLHPGGHRVSARRLRHEPVLNVSAGIEALGAVSARSLK